MSNLSENKLSIEYFCLVNSNGEEFRLYKNIYDIKDFTLQNSELLYINPIDDNYSWLKKRFNDIEVVWVKQSGYILSCRTESRQYETKRSVKIGDPVEKIISLYGSEYSKKNLMVIEYDLGSEEFESMMALVFHLQNERVIKIEIMSEN